MDINFAEFASSLVTWMAPFTPFLLETANIAGKKFTETIAEKGGEAIWDKARGIWNKINRRYKNDTELKSASTLLATKPENVDYQKMLVNILAERLKNEPAFCAELLHDFGGPEAVQQVIAERNSIIENVEQVSEGRASQKIIASNGSQIRNVKQNSLKKK